eukprot:12104645-Alexandrium_andersonii.AAC.1
MMQSALRSGQVPVYRDNYLTAAETAWGSLERFGAFSCKPHNVWYGAERASLLNSRPSGHSGS